MKQPAPASAAREGAAPAKRAAPRKVEVAGRKQIIRGNLHDEVAAVLRDMIIQDELPPGPAFPKTICAPSSGYRVRRCARRSACSPPRAW